MVGDLPEWFFDYWYRKEEVTVLVPLPLFVYGSISYFLIFALEVTPLAFKSFLYAFNLLFGTLILALA